MTRPRCSAAGFRGTTHFPTATSAQHGHRSSTFIDLNDGTWDPDPPDVDEAERAMLAVAAREVDEAWVAAWLRERVRFEATELES